MRLAVISDIHGNLEAMKAVLADIDSLGADTVVCLGDNIGYGPEPQEVIEKIVRLGIPSVMGNHELGAVDTEYHDWFNDHALRVLLLTRDMLSDEALYYCRNLPARMVVENCLFVHGCPPDSALTYIFETAARQLMGLFSDMDQEICFVGHTHMLEIIRYDGLKVQRSPVGRGQVQLVKGCQYIVNVGSVGQPRDGYDKEAKYVLWDSDRRVLEVRFVPYDAVKTAKKILSLGWPKYLAARLC